MGFFLFLLVMLGLYLYFYDQIFPGSDPKNWYEDHKNLYQRLKDKYLK